MSFEAQKLGRKKKKKRKNYSISIKKRERMKDSLWKKKHKFFVISSSITIASFWLETNDNCNTTCVRNRKINRYKILLLLHRYAAKLTKLQFHSCFQERKEKKKGRKEGGWRCNGGFRLLWLKTWKKICNCVTERCLLMSGKQTVNNEGKLENKNNFTRATLLKLGITYYLWRWVDTWVTKRTRVERSLRLEMKR